MNWKKVERQLTIAAREILGAFAKDHANESFYGFIFDCNADYGEVFLCLNTERHFLECASRHYSSYSREEHEDWLRWSAGDWQFHGFNTEPPYAASWQHSWSAVQDAVADASLEDEDESVAPRFLNVACRALIGMERSNAFDCIRRDPGFKTLVIDHDESQGDAWKRLSRVRRAG